MKNALKDICINEVNPKSFLSQIARINTRINAEINQLQELQNFKTSLTGIDYSKAFVLNGRTSDSVSGTVVKLIDLEIDIKNDIYNYTQMKKHIIDMIYKVDDISYMNLLMMRYVDMLSLEQIAVNMNFTYGYVRIIHSKALEKFKSVNKL